MNKSNYFKKKDEILIFEKESEKSFKDIFNLAIHDILTKIDETLLLFLDNIVHKTAKSCIENLEAFHGITAKFRMSNRNPPTKPSNFVSNIFRPFINFLQNNSISGNLKEVLSSVIVQTVMKNFENLLVQILKSTEKSESLMNKYVIIINKKIFLIFDLLFLFEILKLIKILILKVSFLN